MKQLSLASKLYVAAGLANIVGVLLFSRFLTDAALSAPYPQVFSRFGLIMILVWGCAYLAAAPHAQRLRGLALVFAVEKLAYVVSWLVWLRAGTPPLGDLMASSWLVGVFYATYGLNDLFFMGVFAWVGWKATPA